jgi:hypothetical protein
VPTHAGRYRPAAAVRSFARADRRTLAGDALLVLLGLSVPLVALVARVIKTAGVSWIRRRYGIDLAPRRFSPVPGAPRPGSFTRGVPGSLVGDHSTDPGDSLP